MNIAFLMDGFGVGGTELNAARTLEALARRDVHTTVMHLQADGPLRARIADAGHHLIHVPIAPLWHPQIVSSIISLKRELRKARATVLHSQDIYSNIVGVMAGQVHGHLPVLTSRRWVAEVPNRALLPMNAWAHRLSTLVLPNSNALFSTLQSEGVPSKKILLHENFVDESALTLLAAESRHQWRNELNVPKGALIVGCVARLSRVKRHDILLRSFAHVAIAIPAAILMLVGDGDLRGVLEELVIELDLQKRVLFTGTLPNSPLTQQIFDVAVLTSENEGFPNSLVEAAAVGVPMVSTRVGGVPDILLDGVTGVEIAIGDEWSTADALITLLRDDTLRERMGRAARTLAINRFSETAAIDRLIAIYRRTSC